MKNEELINSLIEHARYVCSIFHVWSECHTDGSNRDLFSVVYGNKISSKCAKIFDTSVQHEWVIGIARLTDPATSFGNDNISIKLMLAKISDPGLIEEYKKFDDNNVDFFKSVKKIRDKFLAHNSTENPDRTLKAGTEKFFDFLEKLIQKVKEKNPSREEFNVKIIKDEIKMSTSAFMNHFKL